MIRTKLIFVALIVSTAAFAQDDPIDASKPTNFYTLLDNTLENTASPNQNVFGYRGKFLFAP